MVFATKSLLLASAASALVLASAVSAWAVPITAGDINPGLVVNGDNGNFVIVGQTPDAEPGHGTLAIGAGDDVRVSGTNALIGAGAGTLARGEIAVSGGGKMRTPDLRAGDSFTDGTGGATGTITVTGTGSEIIVSTEYGPLTDPDNEAGFVRVGRLSGTTGSDSGTLNVLDGGRLQISSGETVNTGTSGPVLQIARDRGSNGTVLVDGAGSTIDLFQTAPADAVNGGPLITVGRTGAGSLTIRNGGAVALTGDDAAVLVGRGDGLRGRAVPQGWLEILSGGSLRIGGRSANTGMTVGHEGNGNGVVRISGSGSRLDIIGDGGLGDTPGMTVGRDGIGALTIADGGVLAIETGGAEFGGFAVGGSLPAGADSRTGTGAALVTGAATPRAWTSMPASTAPGMAR